MIYFLSLFVKSMGMQPSVLLHVITSMRTVLELLESMPYRSSRVHGMLTLAGTSYKQPLVLYSSFCTLARALLLILKNTVRFCSNSDLHCLASQPEASSLPADLAKSLLKLQVQLIYYSWTPCLSIQLFQTVRQLDHISPQFKPLPSGSE